MLSGAGAFGFFGQSFDKVILFQHAILVVKRACRGLLGLAAEGGRSSAQTRHAVAAGGKSAALGILPHETATVPFGGLEGLWRQVSSTQDLKLLV